MAKQQFNKLIWLVDTIFRNAPVTFAEINRRWRAGDDNRSDIPLRTFHNHRQAIEEMFDINIECDKRNNTYYIADAEGMLGDKLKMWLLNSFSLNNVLQENVDMKNRIVFEEVPSGVQFMDLVIDAMRSGRVLAMEYQAYNWEHSKDVLLEPYFVKLFRHRWYLIGINREYKAFRSYSLDRIKRIALSEETFNFPRKFTPQDHFRDSFGIIRDENLLPQHTVLRTTISQAPYLRNLPLHSSQKEIAVTESYVDFELYISHTYDFIQELLSKGAAVEVLKPQSLRDKIKAEIQNMQTLPLMNANVLEKLKILAESAKYDVSCASSGTVRANKPGTLGNTVGGWGICHSFAEDGRCISLLKVMLTNYCIYDCAYCINRRSNDLPRATLSVSELVDLTIEFYRRNYIEGLFLSSGVVRNPDYTMERLVRVAKDLREVHRFNGYIHLKSIPGASRELVNEAGRYADRLSVNVEIPKEENLKLLAPEKDHKSVFAPMLYIQQGILESSEERKSSAMRPALLLRVRVHR